MLTTHTSEILNSLLRDELASLETYRQAIEQLEPAPGTATLRRIYEGHQATIAALRQQIQYFGRDVEMSFSSRSNQSNSDEEPVAMGRFAILRSLKEDEERSAACYRDAMSNEDLPTETRAYILVNLLPRVHEHIETLDRLLHGE